MGWLPALNCSKTERPQGAPSKSMSCSSRKNGRESVSTFHQSCLRHRTRPAPSKFSQASKA